MMARTNGHVRRADTICRQEPQRLFGNAVFQGMEGNDAQPSARLQALGSLFQGIVKDSQFIIDFDTDGLERPLGRMGSVLAGTGRDGLLDDLDQFFCPFQGLFPPRLDDEGRNALGPPFFAVGLDDAV